MGSFNNYVDLIFIILPFFEYLPISSSTWTFLHRKCIKLMTIFWPPTYPVCPRSFLMTSHSFFNYTHTTIDDVPLSRTWLRNFFVSLFVNIHVSKYFCWILFESWAICNTRNQDLWSWIYNCRCFFWDSSQQWYACPLVMEVAGTLASISFLPGDVPQVI